MTHGTGIYSNRLSNHVTIAIFLCFILSSAEEIPYLGLIAVPSLSTRTAITAMEIPVYWDFEDQLLVSCSRETVASLERAGFRFLVISKDLHAGSYFLVLFDPEKKIARNAANLLWHNGEWRLVVMTDGEALEAQEAGIRLLKLPSKPHVLPMEVTSLPLTPLKKDTLVGLCIDRIRSDSILNYIRTMQNFQTRYSYAPNCRKAEDYVYNFFKALRLDSVTYDEWSDNGQKARNVIATQVGAVKPDSIMIICGHLDAISNKPQTNAPGADDDASGVAGVMEAARVLSMMKFRWTIKYIAFTGEEQWMKGSGHWVEKVAVPGKLAIFGVYNLDMIGYPPYEDKNTIYVFPNTASTILGDMAEQINKTYQIGLTLKHPVDNSAVGDHTPFWQKRYNAVFVIEAPESAIWGGISPHYHTVADTLGNLSPALLHKTIKMTTGCIAQCAVPSGITGINASSGHTAGQENFCLLRKAAHPPQWEVTLPASSPRACLQILTTQGKCVYSSFIGSSSFIWKGADRGNAFVPSGIYFLRVTSARKEAAFKVLVTR